MQSSEYSAREPPNWEVRDPRQPGEALWPERVSVAEHEAERAADPDTFQAMSQGRPVATQGSLFRTEHIRYWYTGHKAPRPIRYQDAKGQWQSRIQRPLPDKLHTWGQSWDCAFKDIASSDNVVGTVWAMSGINHFMMDFVCDKLDILATCEAIKSLTLQHPKTAIGSKLVEDKANGTAVVRMLRDSVPGLIDVNPEGGKVARANACAPLFRAGNVYFPHPEINPGITEMVNQQLLPFDKGTYDDFVDSVTQWLNYNTNSALEQLKALAVR